MSQDAKFIELEYYLSFSNKKFYYVKDLKITLKKLGLPHAGKKGELTLRLDSFYKSLRGYQSNIDTIISIQRMYRNKLKKRALDLKGPGFIDRKHPDKYHCLPCCFAYPQNTIKYPKSYNKYKKCLGEDVEEINSKDGLIYILGKVSPIEKDRYAILPAEVSRLLNTRLETGYLGINKGYVKKGIKHQNNQSFQYDLHQTIR